jgi:hypothetical protein
MSFWDGFFKQAALKSDVALQPHQERVQQKLKGGGGLLVYHGLGSGKSLTSLAATQGQKPDVVMPAALRQNYAKETKKYTTGHKPNIMSFEKAVKTQPQSKSLVVDEGQNLGRIESKRTREMVEKAPQYEQRMVLTGTPIRNHPSEIAPIMNIVRGAHIFPGDPEAFSKKFIAEEKVHPGIFARIFKGAKPGVRYTIKNPDQFRNLVKGYVDYHAPATENFPSSSHEVVETPMNKEQLQYYKFLIDKAGPALSYKIKRGLPPSKKESAQLNSFMSGVRQVSNSTRPFGGTGDSPKIQRAVHELTKREKKDPNFRAVVYSNYLDAGVKDYAEKLKGIPHAIFDGSLSDKKRKQMIDDYNSGKIKVLLISGAGAQGLDLKGTKLMQLLEPHWNDARLEQAAGRAIRYKSHEHLPIEERHVHVQRFQSTIPKGFLQRKADMSSDQYLDMLSKDKERLNEQFLNILKEVGSEGQDKGRTGGQKETK